MIGWCTEGWKKLLLCPSNIRIVQVRNKWGGRTFGMQLAYSVSPVIIIIIIIIIIINK